MKKVLLLMVAVLMVSAVAANAIEHIGIYSDANGTSCTLAPGFNPNVTVIEKSSTGTTGCRFYVDPGAGNSIFAFNTSWVPVGNIANDLSLAYGSCQAQPGSVVLGTILMSLAGPGSLSVLPAQGFASIIYTDCSFGEHPATGGKAFVTVTGNCEEPLAAQSSTWGQVKALYR